jgi:nucleotide-binding universal stress UspA family protein
MSARTIIVGTDGSPSAKAAVRWAAREAQLRDATLRIVHVFDWEWREARYDYSHDYADLSRKFAEGVAAAAHAQADAEAPGIRIDTEVLMGRAVPRLLAVVANAELLVLGHRGRGGFASLLLGSVSARLSARAACPVVVVRGRADVTDGPVSAGVDDSPAADRVLETAFEAAFRRKAALAVVRSYLPPVPLWLHSTVPAVDVETPDRDAEERARLEQVVAPWAAKYPDVLVTTMLSHDSAAGLLAGVSNGSQLVVVGSHGHGPVAQALLGSTAAQLLHHAACPVYITR